MLPDLLAAVPVPDTLWMEARRLLRLRVRQIEDTTRWRHRVVLLLQSRGMVYHGGRTWTQRFYKWLNRLELGPIDRLTLQSMLMQSDILEAQIRKVASHIAKLVQQDRFRPFVEVLHSVRGAGLLTAMLLALGISGGLTPRINCWRIWG